MRNYGLILCSVLLMTMIFFLGCITQDTGYPDSTPASHGVNGNPPVTTPAPPMVNVHLPLAAPTPKVVYVTVTVPVPTQALVTVPVPASTSVETVCNGTGHPAADIRMTGNVYGLASAPEAGIDEIRLTIGLDSCSPALDLTKVQIVFSTPGTFPVTLTHGTRTSTGFFTTKTGTARVTSMNPGDQVEIAFFVAPVPASTRMNIELKPSGGAIVPLIKTAPARISATNVLW
jgi:archaellin